MTKWKLRAAGAPGGMVADPSELRRGLQLIADPEHGCEIVALVSGRYSTLAGSDLDGLCKAVEGMPAGIGVYVRANPVPLGLPKQANNGDVVKRRWLYLDIDPVKDAAHKDDPATTAEKERSGRLAERVLNKLSGQGWPAPVITDSGNGFALLYRVDLPNDLHWKAVLGRLMKSLATEFSGEDGTVDRHVHNANRLIKLPGTWAKKGKASEDRPHRRCWIVSQPEELLPVPPELIEYAAGVERGTPTPSTNGVNGHANGQASKFTLRAGQGGKHAYARAALDKECARVSLSMPPAQGGEGRNNTLNDAAFRLGTLVAGGELSRNEVENRLTLAAIAAGLEGSEIGGTIRSGLGAGMKHPRVAPEKPTANSAATALPAGESIIEWASEVKTRPVEWLWPGRIPLGKLTTFAGIGGLGKTFVLCDIAARVTRGLEWPDGKERATVGKVLFISGEDEPDDTLVPRMIEMNADLSKVAFLKTAAADQFQLSDLPLLERAIDDMAGDVRFVAIDPPTAYLGDANDNSNSELRALLSPLRAWAAKHNLAIIFNTHINKGGGAKVEAMMRVMGSVAWVNAVRAAHLFARDPDDPDRIFFCFMKNNLGPRKTALAYKLEAVGPLAKVEWLGEVNVSADDAVNGGKNKSRGESASEWLVERFREKRTWDSDTLIKEAAQAGISRNALFEAKKKLSLPKCRKQTCENGDVVWQWWVPDDWSQLGVVEEGIPL